jgi:membrane associated rhomboid family serine protease
MIPLRDTQPSYSTPFVTMAIIAVNIMVFFHQISLNTYEMNEFISRYAIIPDRFQYVDLLTSMFMHGGWMHLVGNMWFLWIYGDNIEDILGHAQYFVFYVLSGAAAGLIHVMLEPNSLVPTLGASGAIAGVMGAYMVKFPHSRILTLVPIIIFFTTMEIPAFIMLLYWFALQIFSGVGSLSSYATKGGTAWFAHIGGFVAGVLLIFAMHTKERFRHRKDLRW